MLQMILDKFDSLFRKSAEFLCYNADHNLGVYLASYWLGHDLDQIVHRAPL